MLASARFPSCGLSYRRPERFLLFFPSAVVAEKMLARMPDDRAVVEWELHTLEDMRRKDNHQRPIKSWS